MQPVTASPRCTPRTCTNLRLRLRGSSGCGMIYLSGETGTFTGEAMMQEFCPSRRITILPRVGVACGLSPQIGYRDPRGAFAVHAAAERMPMVREGVR